MSPSRREAKNEAISSTAPSDCLTSSSSCAPANVPGTRSRVSVSVTSCTLSSGKCSPLLSIASISAVCESSRFTVSKSAENAISRHRVTPSDDTQCPSIMERTVSNPIFCSKFPGYIIQFSVFILSDCKITNIRAITRSKSPSKAYLGGF